MEKTQKCALEWRKSSDHYRKEAERLLKENDDFVKEYYVKMNEMEGRINALNKLIIYSYTEYYNVCFEGTLYYTLNSNHVLFTYDRWNLYTNLIALHYDYFKTKNLEEFTLIINEAVNNLNKRRF